MSAAASLQKLTVPQLKALCKERKISGYSKLGKAALVEKLLAAQAKNEGVQEQTTYQVQKPLLRGSLSRPGNENIAAHASPTLQRPEDTNDAHIVRPGASQQCCDPGRARDAPENNTTSFVSSPDHPSLRNFAPTETSVRQLPTSSHIMAASAVLSNSTTYEDAPNARNKLDGRDGNPNVKKRAAEPLSGQEKKRKLHGSSVTLGTAESWPVPPPQPLHPMPHRNNEPSTATPPNVTQKPPLKNALSATRALLTSVNSPATSLSAGRISALSVGPRAPSTTTVSCLVPPDITIGSCLLLDTNQRTQPQISAKTTQRKDLGPAIPKPVGKRFQKLVVTKRPAVPASKGAQPQPPAGQATAPPRSTCPPALHCLDFPLSLSVPPLTSITLPPSLTQRKRVQNWAIILSGLSDTDRRRCVLVSRMFRYAVYLSASHILEQRHAGRRLSQDVAPYSQAMTNMWPYLRVREAEATQRRLAYDTSFLGTFIRTRGLPEPIAVHLWSSPDDHRQIGMALRFVLTRLWFALSIGSGAGMGDPKAVAWLKAVVVDVQPVVAHEIWSITVEHCYGSARSRDTIYVLEATCEPVGHPEVAPQPGELAHNPDPASALPIRADWSGYIHRCLGMPRGSSQTATILDQLKWANREEYERGISRLWLKRIEKEGDIGTAKGVVAERYVLACVVANSVSGQWKSASEMAQDFAGLSSRSYASSARPRNAQVCLYLPEHHHIESVHFEGAQGQPLHPALAVVQTPHRAYYILRDIGMQVGCEEDGVSEVWQEVVGCDASGQ